MFLVLSQLRWSLNAAHAHSVSCILKSVHAALEIVQTGVSPKMPRESSGALHSRAGERIRTGTSMSSSNIQ